MNVSDFRYIGEGGKHALFEHAQELPGRLLRIAKSDLASKARHSNHQYVTQVVAPQLQPYVDVPDSVALNWDSLQVLWERTLSSGRIPASRRKDWSRPSVAWASVVVDYRKLPGRVSEPGTHRRISIEIKPKAGYLAFSPLVQHPVKFRYSRFHLLQVLHQRGLIDKGWTASHQIRPSHYEPLDLYSKRPDRMRRAVQELLACPQNNLKVWYNDAPIINDTIPSGELESADPCCDFGDTDTWHSFLVELIVQVLQQERSILEKLWKLQTLDILDADGAVRVLERLVEVCQGSIDQACASLQDMKVRDPIEAAVHPLLKESPFAMANTDTLQQFCEQVDRFKDLLESPFPNLPCESIRKSFHDEACAMVATMSQSECKYLLANWLLSLAMCDVSMFLTVEYAPSTSEWEEQVRNYQNDTADGCGSVDVAVGERHFTAMYRLRLIDYDEKPASKLIGRKKKEAMFGQLQDLLRKD